MSDEKKDFWKKCVNRDCDKMIDKDPYWKTRCLNCYKIEKYGVKKTHKWKCEDCNVEMQHKTSLCPKCWIKKNPFDF